MEQLIIVNDKDEVIGSRGREEILPDDIYRISCLWITNSKNQILLAQRNLNKKHNPGKWEKL